MFGNDQKRTASVRESAQERSWNPLDDHAPMEEVSAWEEWCCVLCLDNVSKRKGVCVCERGPMSPVLAPALRLS